MTIKKSLYSASAVAVLGAALWTWGYTSNHTVKTNVVEVEKEKQSRNMIAYQIPQLDPSVRQLISDAVDKYSKEYNLDPALVIAVMGRESSFNLIAKSEKDCIGLMQINPSAHKDKIGRISFAGLYHIDTNIRIGCQILAEYINKNKTIKEALTDYVGGYHPTYVNDVMSTYADMSIKVKQ